jgi:5'-nucleotidase
MEEIGDVWVVAPDSEQSGVGCSISLREPLRLEEHAERRLSVSGSPADCVYVALNHILDEPPDLCLSGINHGANLADDLLYSGTVAGAIEATLSDVPSIAVSLAGRTDMPFGVAGDFAASLARRVLDEPLPRDVLLNVNVPESATADTEARVVNLGRRNYRRDVTRKVDPYDRPYFWLGGSELGFDDLPGSDCNAITNSTITITPVHLDLTHHSFMDEMRDWALDHWDSDDDE